MSSVVLQLSTNEPVPGGAPPPALGALSRQLSASSLDVSPLSEMGVSPEAAAAGVAATLAVSLASREAARSLAAALAAWSGQHPSSRITVQLGGSSLEVSGAIPQSTETLLQRLVAAVPEAAGFPASPSPAASSAPFRLRQLPDGPETPITGTVIAGRHPDSGLRLPAPASPHGGPSRRHAQLSVTDGTLWVEDLGSKNGTFVNGIRVARMTRLRQGDRLRFDTVEFEVLALALPPPDWQENTLLRMPPRRPPQPEGLWPPLAAANAAARFPDRFPVQTPPVAGGISPPLSIDELSAVAFEPEAGTPRVEARGGPKTLFIPAEEPGKEMTALIVDGSARTPPSRQAAAAAGRRTEIRILDDQRPIDVMQPLQPRQRYTLEVAIRREHAHGPLGAVDAQRAPEWVWVVLTDETDGDPAIDGRLFELDHRYTALMLPMSGDSQGLASFRFAARPPPDVSLKRREICARIGVRVYHKLNLIDHTQIDLCFAQNALRSAPAAAAAGQSNLANLANLSSLSSQNASMGVRIKSMQVERRLAEQPSPDNAARALTISISKPDPLAPYYRFALVAANRVHPEQPGLFASRKLAQEELEGFATRFRDILLKAVFGRSLTDVNLSITEQESLLSQLAALGDGMVARLFSPAAQDDILEPGEQLPEGSIIQICLGEGAQDLTLPWQILTLKPATDRDSPADPRNFWGYRFVIEIKRSGDGVDGRPLSARSPSTTRVTYARWGFENEASHHAHLKAIVSESPFPAALTDPAVEAREPFVDTLLAGGGHLIYVYAPGHSAPPPAGRGATTAQARIADLGSQLEGTIGMARSDVENLRRVRQQFLRAARPDAGSALSLKHSEIELSALSARMKRDDSRLADAPIVFLNNGESAQVWNALTCSFPAFFLDHGARAVLTTESTVPRVVADVFGLAVLERLFKGETLGRAVLAARLKLLKEHRNPLGLCYCLYGASDARLTSRAQPEEREDRPSAALTFTSGPAVGGRYILRLAAPPGETSQWELGSDTSQDIIVTGEGVSRQHALIVHEEGRRFVITDRSSRNGTFVNGRRVESCVLTPGSEIRLGTVTIAFELFDRSGRAWGSSPGADHRQHPQRAPIDTVLLLVASVVGAAVLFFVLSFLRSH